MPSPMTETRLRDIRLPEFDRPSFEMPDIELPKLDRNDIGKAVMNAATTVGLVKTRRARWPFALGAVVTVAAVGLAAANADAIRDSIGTARRWFADRLREMRSGSRVEPVAFPAADTKPIHDADVSSSTSADYPEGLGTPMPELADVNGRTAVTSPR